MENFRAARGEGMGFVVAELVEKPRLGGFVRIRGVDTVDVGPNDELIGVHDVGDDGPGKIGAVAAERGDPAVGSCADEAGNDRNDTGFEKRKKNAAAALFAFFEMGLGVAESVAGQHETRRGDGDGGDAGLFESGGKEPGAETFAKGGQTIEKLGTSSNGVVNRNLMKKVAAQKLQLATDAEVRVLSDPDRAGINALTKMEVVKHIRASAARTLFQRAFLADYLDGMRADLQRLRAVSFTNDPVVMPTATLDERPAGAGIAVVDIGRAGLDRAWLSALCAKLDVELTDRALDARQARLATGRWPPMMPYVSSTVVPSARWIYGLRAPDEISISLSRALPFCSAPLRFDARR